VRQILLRDFACSVCKGLLEDIKSRVTGYAGEGDTRPIREITADFSLRIMNRDDYRFCQENRQEHMVLDNLKTVQDSILAQPFALMQKHHVDREVVKAKQLAIVEKQAELKAQAEKAGMKRKKVSSFIGLSIIATCR